MPRLTDARVRDLRPKKNTRNIRDTALVGFGVRVLPSGQKRFFLHSQHDGQRIWKIIGDPADMTVTEARDRAEPAKHCCGERLCCGPPPDRRPTRQA